MLVHVSITCTQLIVRLRRALKPGEHRVKLHMLRINEPEVLPSFLSLCSRLVTSPSLFTSSLSS